MYTLSFILAVVIFSLAYVGWWVVCQKVINFLFPHILKFFGGSR